MNNADDINIRDLRELLLSRSEVGINKYGVTTDRAGLPLGDWLKHALEETLDNAVYLRQAMRILDQSPQGYEAWRLTFQSSEQAAKSAYSQVESQGTRIAELESKLESQEVRVAELTKEIELRDFVIKQKIDLLESCETALEKAYAPPAIALSKEQK